MRREPNLRERMFELLDAVAAKDWAKVRKLARCVQTMGPPSQRHVYVRQWIDRHREKHPRVVEWVERKMREAESQAATEPSWTGSAWPGIAWRLRWFN